ncbi:hypothetical protein BDD12DRAFT_940550 [Trichophaea hybrida]|nr:hypothetical protein BDD12DRAFT_940550 [Trichophaea hybrida]
MCLDFGGMTDVLLDDYYCIGRATYSLRRYDDTLLFRSDVLLLDDDYCIGRATYSLRWYDDTLLSRNDVLLDDDQLLYRQSDAQPPPGRRYPRWSDAQSLPERQYNSVTPSEEQRKGRRTDPRRRYPTVLAERRTASARTTTPEIRLGGGSPFAQKPTWRRISSRTEADLEEDLPSHRSRLGGGSPVAPKADLEESLYSHRSRVRDGSLIAIDMEEFFQRVSEEIHGV